ncbi:MAG TPA: flagellar hook-basal body complex protein [Rhodospirillaceae bacterium]|nr:flagellar hook-basal body complex protein [Rhodospirillaceae bacterium]
MSTWTAMINANEGMAAQSVGLSAVSQNIANLNTNGYKATEVSFADVLSSVTPQATILGVRAIQQNRISSQGTIQTTQNWNDIAIQGNGFFIVNTAVNGTGNTQFTRDGGLVGKALGLTSTTTPSGATTTTNANATYVTSTTGNYVMGWANGTLPGNSLATMSAVNYTLGSVMAAKATTTVDVATNLPSDAPVYNPLNPSAGGLSATNIPIYDTLGNSGNSQLVWTKNSANSWGLTVQPPSGAAVANLANTSYLNGTRFFASQGQLEFSSVPPAGSYFSLNSTVTGGQPATVQVQFYDSRTGLDPTKDGATLGTAANPYVLGVDLAGVNDPSQLASAIQTAIGSAANNPAAKGTFGMANIFQGGVTDGSNRFVADKNVLRLEQIPGAAAINVNCASNTTTKLGTSIVQSGTGAGGTSTATGQFTIQQIDPAYTQVSTAGDTNSLTLSAVNNTVVLGNASFTVNSAPPTGSLTVGTANVAWSDIAAGGNGYPYTNASSTLQLAANAAYWVNNTAGVAGVSASFNGATVVLSTANATATDVTPDTAGAAGEVTWANNTDGLSAESVSPGNYLQVGNIQIPWAQLISGQVTSYSDAYTGVSTTLATPLTLAYGASGTSATALATTDTDKLANNITSALTQLAAVPVTIPGSVTARQNAVLSSKIDLTSGGTPTSVFINNGDAIWANGQVADKRAVTMGQSSGFSATGTGATFNGDGTVAATIANTMQVYWANGASPQAGTGGDISLNMSGLRQLTSSTGQGDSTQQDGYAAGTLTTVSFDGSGVLNGNFSNGKIKALYTLGIATFTAPDALAPSSNNVFSATEGAGAMNISTVAGLNGQTSLVTGAVESSNVSVDGEFTTMIITQRAYEMNSQVFKASDEMTQRVRDLVA